MEKCRHCGLDIVFTGERWMHPSPGDRWQYCAFANYIGGEKATWRGETKAEPLTKEDRIQRLLKKVDEM